MMKRTVGVALNLVLAIALSVSAVTLVHAAGATAKPRKKTASKYTSHGQKTSCSKLELEIKDCRLELGEHRVFVGAEKMRLSDGVWKAVQDFPIKGSGTQWQELRLRQLGSTTVLEMRIWDEVQGDMALQNLHWIVYRLHHEHGEVQVQQVVAKRRKGEVVTQDRPVPTELTAGSAQRVRWRVGQNTGEF